VAAFFSKLKSGLSKTRSNLIGGIAKAVTGKQALDDDVFDEIEELLITADIGVDTTFEIIENLRKKLSRSDRKSEEAVMQQLRAQLVERIQFTEKGRNGENETVEKPRVIMVTGINGVGKTTTIGKLAHHFREEGKSVVLGAADTFRAAASQQLEIWAERCGAEIVRNKPGADPASVAFDTVTAATNRNADIALIDTAGRLHTKTNLMEELKKIHRTIQRKMPSAPHEVLLVMDATTGQNGLAQAKIFHEAVGITAIALTKLDGTAKGGTIVAIQKELQVPVKYVGVGEQIDDLQPFSAEMYVEALFA